MNAPRLLIFNCISSNYLPSFSNFEHTLNTAQKSPEEEDTPKEATPEEEEEEEEVRE